MRIGLFAPYDLARPGGIATHIRAQAAALRALGHAVRVHGPASAALSDGEVPLGPAIGVTIGGTTSGIALDPRCAWRAREILHTERFDVVHVHEPLMPVAAWAAVWFARAPVAATFHVHREEGHRFYPVARPLLAPIAARIGRRIAVSPSARRTVARHFPADYAIVPNGIDLQRFRRPAPRPASIDAAARHVLFVGRLERRKGVRHLIGAMARVQRRIPGARLVVAGDGPERGALERLAAAAGVDAIFAGEVPDVSLPGLYQWSDVVCSPALGGESFGIVLLEAAAAGTPVVATRIAGYEDLIGGADCGRLVPPADDTALADAIEALLEDDAVRHDCAARGVEFARRFDWSVIARCLQTLYEEMLDSTPGRAR
jgi:phosphatidyl-myo-inositol alpha-mannosyltransferase